jgi:hypothetical protein
MVRRQQGPAYGPFWQKRLCAQTRWSAAAYHHRAQSPSMGDLTEFCNLKCGGCRTPQAARRRPAYLIDDHSVDAEPSSSVGQWPVTPPLDVADAARSLPSRLSRHGLKFHTACRNEIAPNFTNEYRPGSRSSHGAGCDRMGRREPWTYQPQPYPDFHPGCHRPTVVHPDVGWTILSRS